MNKRFNDLRLEAGISRLHEVPYMVAVNKEGEIIEPLDGLQKFAELIVRECAELCSTNEMTIEPFGKKSYRTGRHFSALLKGHFGVEE